MPLGSEEGQIDFEDGGPGFLTETISAIFLSTSCSNISDQVSSLLAFRLRICTILANFNLQVTLTLPMKVSKQLAFQLRRRITFNIFSGCPWQPSWICVGTIKFLQKKTFKIYHQDGCHLGFPIGRILAISDVQANLIITSYEVLSQLAIPFR